MIETATANIRHFLKDKTSVAHVRLEHADQDFPVSWDLVGGDGSLEDALSEWRVSPHLYRRVRLNLRTRLQKVRTRR